MARTSSRETVAASDLGAGYAAYHGAAGASLGLVDSAVAIVGVCLVVGDAMLCFWGVGGVEVAQVERTQGGAQILAVFSSHAAKTWAVTAQG